MDSNMLRMLAFVCLGLSLTGGQLRSEELIHWHEDLATARQLSQQYKVPLLIHFYGDQCLPCKTLEKNVFSRPEVASTMQRYFVPVRINATHDRRTAAIYGVHSWPTDVFVAPDGKTLLQGVCNQNAGSYLQHLQSVALMNRDRNAMLAGSPPAPPSASAQAQSGSATGSQNGPAATAMANGQTTAGAYGRTAGTNLQQSAPGREAAPSPYDNPSHHPTPYSASSPNVSLISTQLPPSDSSSSLPSPAWQGQTAHGLAETGQVAAGPLSSAPPMTLHPSQPATSTENKAANLPPTVQWQSTKSKSNAVDMDGARSDTVRSDVPFPMVATPSPSLAALGQLPLAPTVPAPKEDAASPRSRNGNNGYLNGRTVIGREAMIDNPHFHAGAPAPQANQPATNAGSDKSKPSYVSAPALGGYCPVELFGETSSWTKGSEQIAVRHRGRVYLLSTEEAAQKFLANPDAYTPVLSGHDPLVFLREGRLIEGSIYEGVLKDRQHIMLFASEANKAYFYEHYDRLVADLEELIRHQVGNQAASR